ncbi:Beta-galactosidase 8-like protein, partial [Drosera capensis]
MATMRGRETAMAMLAAVIIVLSVLTVTSFAANVTYDRRALVIDGSLRLLISGSIHYPRSRPEVDSSFDLAHVGGFDTEIEGLRIERDRGIRYDFSGRKDLVKFIKLVGDAGLHAHFPIGPYVCAEWNYGGFPLWLHFVPGIVFRTDNQPFKKNNLYASQGGPIIELAAVYKTGSGSCAAFLANVGTSDANVNCNENSYQLPAWSVSILPDCRGVALNTAKMNSVSILPKFTPQALNDEIDSLGRLESSWAWFSEPI